MARKQYAFAYTPNVACNNEALAIACEANGDHLKANMYWHKAMKAETLKEGSNPKRVTYLHRRALNSFHHYEINKAAEELL